MLIELIAILSPFIFILCLLIYIFLYNRKYKKNWSKVMVVKSYIMAELDGKTKERILETDLDDILYMCLEEKVDSPKEILDWAKSGNKALPIKYTLEDIKTVIELAKKYSKN